MKLQSSLKCKKRTHYARNPTIAPIAVIQQESTTSSAESGPSRTLAEQEHGQVRTFKGNDRWLEARSCRLERIEGYCLINKDYFRVSVP